MGERVKASSRRPWRTGAAHAAARLCQKGISIAAAIMEPLYERQGQENVIMYPKPLNRDDVVDARNKIEHAVYHLKQGELAEGLQGAESALDTLRRTLLPRTGDRPMQRNVYYRAESDDG